MVKLIDESYSNFYYANCVSKATCICMLFSFTAVLAPFYLAFTTNNFWLNYERDYEHPKVTFISANHYPISSSVTLPTVSVYPVWKDKQTGELNADRYDELVAPMKMRAITFLDFKASHTFESVKFYGDLTIKQQSAFFAGNQNINQFNLTTYTTGATFIDTVTSQTRFMNTTLQLDYQYFTYVTNSATTTTISGKIHIPRYTPITYIPSFSETIKFAWAAYFSIFVVLLYICRGLLKRIYRFSSFSVSVNDNLPESTFLHQKLKQD